MAVAANNALYARRRLRNNLAKGLALAATAFGLGWLVLILGVLVFEGLGGVFSVNTESDRPPRPWKTSTPRISTSQPRPNAVAASASPLATVLRSRRLA